MTAADKNSSIGQILSASFIPETQSLNLTEATAVTDQTVTKDASVEQIFRAVFDPATQALRATGGASDIIGSIDTGQVAFASAPNTIAGSNDFTWDNATKVLSVIGNISVLNSVTPTINIGAASPFRLGVATAGNQFFTGSANGDVCIQNRNTGNQFLIGTGTGAAQMAVNNTVILSNIVHRFSTVGASRMAFTDGSSNLSGNANYTVNGTGNLTIAQTLTAAGGAFSAGVSGFNITGTNQACNIGTNFNLAQASGSAAFFSGTASGDSIIRQTNTGLSVYIGVGSTTAQFIVRNTVINANVGITLPTSGATAASLNYYEDETAADFNLSMNTPDGTARNLAFRVARVGKIVVLQWSSLSVTASVATTFVSAVGLPAKWRPVTTIGIRTFNIVNDNSVAVPGMVDVANTGIVTFSVGVNISGNFTASGTASIYGNSVSYVTA